MADPQESAMPDQQETVATPDPTVSDAIGETSPSTSGSDQVESKHVNSSGPENDTGAPQTDTTVETVDTPVIDSFLLAALKYGP